MQEDETQRIRQILSYSPAIVYACRAFGDYGATFVSDNVTTILGYPVRECLETPDFWRSNIHPEDRERVLSDYADFFVKGYHVHEYRFRRKNGDYLWVRDELRLIHDAAGSPVELVGSWIDISTRKAAEAALEKSEALFRKFFEANPVATIITSPSGVVHMVNPAFSQNTDFSAEDVVGRTAQELGFWRKPEDRERMVAAIRERGFIDNLESNFNGKGGKPMTCVISSRAIELDGELRILSIVNDVTEQRLAEEALSKLDQTKSDFISTAAHELRTPLIAVIGYCELLESAADRQLSEKKKAEYLAIIQSNAELLNRLVDDLLDVGRIQFGRSLNIVRKECDLGGVIKQVVESLQVRSRQHVIDIQHCNALPQSVRMDGARIAQVLNNLLDNAIKFSPGGGPITIETRTDEAQVAVAVIDRGQGMSPQQVERAFDRFYRGASGKMAVSGLGLGMGIVRQIISDHGGEVFIASAPGEGTTVTFTLPVRG